MRGLAFRKMQARNKYMRRARQIYDVYGGFKVVNGKVVRCESIKDYLDSSNPYFLKTQGNFEHHSEFDEKQKQQILKTKDKIRAKKQIQESLTENYESLVAQA